MGEAAVRAIPFDLVFLALTEERFPAIRAALQEAGADPFERDGFLMVRPVVELVRELRPEDGLGEGVEELVALVHLAYLYWEAGQRTVTIGPRTLERLLAAEPPPPAPGEAPTAYYVQYPARRVWGEPVAGAPHEPLDGAFVARAGPARMAAAVFGFHPDRAGFTVVEVVGERPGVLARTDDAPLFAPVLPGGAGAGLHSLVGMEELLELVWRGDLLLGGRGGGSGPVGFP